MQNNGTSGNVALDFYESLGNEQRLLLHVVGAVGCYGIVRALDRFGWSRLASLQRFGVGSHAGFAIYYAGKLLTRRPVAPTRAWQPRAATSSESDMISEAVAREKAEKA